jgi:Zn-dependent protease
MGRRVRLGRIRGLEIAVDWSWFAAFGLGAWTLITILPRVRPAMPPGELAGLSLFGAAGVLASLGVHEIARALAERACGIPVRRVTLFLLGSVTDAETDRRLPSGELVAAPAAFLASTAIGIALLAVSVVFHGDVQRGAPGAMLLEWLALANIGVAVINLLPAYPLDAGRVFRAIAWRATDDVERATRWSAWSAEILGWLAVVVGVSLVFATHDVAMAAWIWVAIAGWFLASAATQAYEHSTFGTV